MIKALITILFIIMVTVPANAQEIWSTNWDTGTPHASWPCKAYPGDCTVRTFDGFYNGAWYCAEGYGTQSGLSSVVKQSVEYSFQMVQQNTEAESCPIQRDFGFASKSKIHIRFYIYFPSSAWANFNYSPNWIDVNAHFLFLNTALNSDNRVLVDIGGWASPPYACYHTPGATNAYFKLLYGSSVPFTEPTPCWNVFDNLDAWHAVEFMFDIGESLFAMWIDDVQLVGTGGNGVAQSYPGVTGFGSDHSGGAVIFSFFRSGDQPTYQAGTVSYYLDDIVIADSYIGEEPTTPNLIGATIKGGSIK